MVCRNYCLSNIFRILSIFIDLRYVYQSLANEDDVIDISEDFSQNLINRLEFNDNLIKTLFDRLLQKYIIEPTKSRSKISFIRLLSFIFLFVSSFENIELERISRYTLPYLNLSLHRRTYSKIISFVRFKQYRFSIIRTNQW